VCARVFARACVRARAFNRLGTDCVCICGYLFVKRARLMVVVCVCVCSRARLIGFVLIVCACVCVRARAFTNCCTDCVRERECWRERLIGLLACLNPKP
jgi:hypothetical protein